MQSPFFWRNLGVLLLVLANLVLSVRLMQLNGAPTSPTQSTVAVGVILRGATLTYAALSFIVAFVTIILFLTLEVFSGSRASWQRNARWSEIREGMTQPEVLHQLGEPFQRLSSEAPSTGPEEQFAYQLHPLGPLDGAVVAFHRDASGGMTVAYKSPDNEVQARGRAEWVPGGYARSRYRDTIRESALILAFVGIILLGVASLFPFGVRAGAYSWTLYIPLLALVLGLIHEACGPRGWRYDLMLIYPLYAVILIGWAVRLVPLLRGRA